MRAKFVVVVAVALGTIRAGVHAQACAVPDLEGPPPFSRLTLDVEMVNLLAQMFELEAGLAHSAGLAAAVYRDDGQWYSHRPGTAELLNRYFGPTTRHTAFPTLPSDPARVAQAVAELFGARITWATRRQSPS